MNTQRFFVGRAWLNQTDEGQKYFNADFDNQIQNGDDEYGFEAMELIVTDEDDNKKKLRFEDFNMQMFKNDKRDENDADLRVSLVPSLDNNNDDSDEDEVFVF